MCNKQKPQKFTSKKKYSSKREHEFPCAKRTLRLPGRSRTSSTAAGNLEPEDGVEIKEGDKKRRNTEGSWSMSGEFVYRHHEQPRLKFYNPDHESLQIPLKYVDVMRQIQTSINKVSEHIIKDLGTEAKGVTLSEDWDYKIPDPTYKTS